MVLGISLLACGPAPRTAAPASPAVPPAPVATPTSSAAFPSAQARIPVSDADPQVGARDAPLTVVVYAGVPDMGMAPYVAALRAIQRQLGPDAMRIVWKDYFVSANDKRAVTAELIHGVYRAGGSDAFARFLDVVLPHRGEIDASNVGNFAQLAGVPDAEAVATGVINHAWQADIDASRASATALGVHASPTTYVNGIESRGLLCIENLVDAFTAELAAARVELDRGVAAIDIYGLRTSANAQRTLRVRSRDWTAPDASGACPAWWVERYPAGTVAPSE